MSSSTPLEYCITAGQAFNEPDLLYTEPDEITPMDRAAPAAFLHLGGPLDEIAFFDRALTAQEIEELYALRDNAS